MKAFTYIDKGHFGFVDKPKPTLQTRSPWYMGTAEDNIMYDSDEIDIDQLNDWD